jgi:hypothetical protein
MEHVPEYVRAFLRQLPNNWDDVRFVDGYPGEYVIVARRSGEKWYIAGINGSDSVKEITMNLSFIKNRNAKIIGDGEEPQSFSPASFNVPDNGSPVISIKARGGFVDEYLSDHSITLLQPFVWSGTG